MYRVDKGIRCPSPTNHRERKYPMRELEIGDSFLVPAKAVGPNTAAAIRNVARHMKVAIVTRTMPDGLRVWRVVPKKLVVPASSACPKRGKARGA